MSRFPPATLAAAKAATEINTTVCKSRRRDVTTKEDYAMKTAVLSVLGLATG